ncbi:MAG TPA: hypothetical protein VGI03_08430 [Verrucomicrobiae bacterium]|jgi:hypothetical protein
MKTIRLNSWHSAIIAAALIASTLASRGQGTLASGTISSVQEGPSLWLYTITLTDTGANPIDSLWYAWTPDVSPNFYLPDSNLSDISGTLGWTGSGVANSIQFSGGTAITTGQSVLLSYEADFSPATLAGTANSGLSVAYDGGIEGGPGTPDFTITAAPEPGSLAILGMAFAGLTAVGKRFKK